MDLKTTLKMERLKACITQKELGKRIGVTPQSISNYETGKSAPTMKAIKRYADEFGIDVSELVMLKYEETTHKD